MIDFPQATAYGKSVPFARLKEKGLAPRFCAHIKSLVWAHKLHPDTFHLAATGNVKEIEVMDLTVKGRDLGVRSLAAVISALDRLIPSPLIFRVFDEDGAPFKVAFNIKTSGGAVRGDSEVFRLFQTDDTDLAVPQGLTTLESFFRNLAAAVGGMATSPGESLDELNARHYRIASLRADLADREKKIAREQQLGRKYALVKEKQVLEKAIAELVRGGLGSRRAAGEVRG